MYSVKIKNVTNTEGPKGKWENQKKENEIRNSKEKLSGDPQKNSLIKEPNGKEW